MGVPGQYPNNPAREHPISLDEMKIVPCKACGEHRRRTFTWVERLVHRFKAALSAQKVVQAEYCLGCDRQLTLKGDEVQPDEDGYLPFNLREKL